MSYKEWKQEINDKKKQERAKLKDMSMSKKIGYIWDYYKLPIIAGIALIIIAVSIFNSILKPKPNYMLNMSLVNSYLFEIVEDGIFKDFETKAGYDKINGKLNINTNIRLSKDMSSQTDMANYQLMFVMFAAGEIDLFISDSDIFDEIGSSGGLINLDEVLPEHVYEKHKDRIYTTYNEETKETYLNGIILPQESILMKEGVYSEAPVAGITYKGENLEEAKRMLLYLLDENIEEIEEMMDSDNQGEE